MGFGTTNTIGSAKSTARSGSNVSFINFVNELEEEINETRKELNFCKKEVEILTTE